LLNNPSPDPLVTNGTIGRRKNFSKDLKTMTNKFFTYTGDTWNPGKSQIGDW